MNLVGKPVFKSPSSSPTKGETRVDEVIFWILASYESFYQLVFYQAIGNQLL